MHDAQDFFRNARRAMDEERSIPEYVSTAGQSNNAAVRKKDKYMGV